LAVSVIEANGIHVWAKQFPSDTQASKFVLNNPLEDSSLVKINPICIT
jgi:hypothetical protein